MRAVPYLVVAALTLAACGDDPSPTQPTPAPATVETRVIFIETATLDFGQVEVGNTYDRSFRVFNQGNAALTITGLVGNAGGVLTASPTSGTIQPGGSLTVLVRYAPVATGSISGTITINANHTSGTNTIAYSGSSVDIRPLFTRSGKGNQVWDLPSGITRLRVQGIWDRTSNSNFIVRYRGSTIVNEILRESITYDGTHLISGLGGTIETVSSGQISWTFTEVR